MQRTVRNRLNFRRFIIPLLFLSFITASFLCEAQATPLNPYAVVYGDPPPVDDKWTSDFNPLLGGNDDSWMVLEEVIINGENRTGSLISNFKTTEDFIFSGQMQDKGDNALMGFVFGWQDHDNTYSVSWGGGGVSPSWNGYNILKQVDNTNTVFHYLEDEDPPQLTSGPWYDFSVVKTGSTYTIDINNAFTHANIFSHSFTDSTFDTGHIGLQVYNQSAYFQNLDFEGSVTVIPESVIPEPATMLLLGSGLIGLAGVGRKKFKK